MVKQMKWSLLLLLGALGIAHASILVDQAQVVSASKSLATMVPSAKSVTIATAGTYTLTLSDVQGQSGPGNAFTSLSVVISQGSQLVKKFVLPAGKFPDHTAVS